MTHGKTYNKSPSLFLCCNSSLFVRLWFHMWRFFLFLCAPHFAFFFSASGGLCCVIMAFPWFLQIFLLSANPNKHKSNKHTKSTKISSLFPKRGNRNAKRTEKHNNKITQCKTQNKSPRRINHKATKCKINTRTTAL